MTAVNRFATVPLLLVAALPAALGAQTPPTSPLPDIPRLDLETQLAPPPPPLALPRVDPAGAPGAPAPGAPVAIRPGRDITAESVAAFFDAAFEVQRLDHAMVGAVVSVVHDGEVLFERGYGWADLDRRVPADPGKSLFRIASITKTFVWTAIMQLVEEGRVDLDADVSRYLDFEIPVTFDEPIRVRHLLSHTPGFEETWTGWMARDAGDVRDLGEALADLMPARIWPPGEHAAYSNYGAALAGYVVERVSGRPWAEYVEERILQPLGMRSTNARVEMRPRLRARHARGYVYADGRFSPTPYRYLHLTPAGMMSSTASDMGRFMLAHLNGGALGDARILSAETVRLMHSPLFAPHEGLRPILHGFYRSDRNGRVVFGHGGDTNQFHSNMSLLPEAGLGVFVSYNSDPASVARSNVVAAFVDHFFPAEHLRPAPEPVDLDLSDYAGEYIPLRSAFSTFERVRSVFNAGSIEANGRALRLNGGGRLVATGPDRFTGLYADVPVVFERDERGEVTHMIVGSPLSTLRKARGLEGGLAYRVALFVILVSLGALVVWTYRLLRPIPEERRLPSPHVRLALVHAALMAALPLLFLELAGNTATGMPVGLRALLLVYDANLVLGLLVIGLSAGQWLARYGTLAGRVGYALVASAAALNIALAWSFNLVGSLF